MIIYITIEFFDVDSIETNKVMNKTQPNISWCIPLGVPLEKPTQKTTLKTLKVEIVLDTDATVSFSNTQTWNAVKNTFHRLNTISNEMLTHT